MSRIFPIGVLLLGAWLRFHTLVQDSRLQADEALFSTFARAAALNGDWWLSGPLDKPPLTLYLNALSQVLVGDSELAARLPGLLASILLMPVMYALAKSLYQHTVVRAYGGTPLPMIALILTALSPFALAFSATAFTDGPTLLFITLALWMMARGRWGWSAVWLGIGFASKQQALFYLPLLIALGWGLGAWSIKRFSRFMIAFTLLAALVMVWDGARPGTSLFALAIANNDPGRLIRAHEIGPRLQMWLGYGQFLIGPGWLTALLTINALVVLVWRTITEPRRRNTLADLVLLAFIMTYGLLHWLVAFNTYDRYLLLILPLLILLVGRGLARLPVRHRSPLLLIVLMAVLLLSAMTASDGRGSINSGHRDMTGIDELAVWLNQQPVATVIYDRWLGWELGYYLGQWHDKRLTYYPTPAALVTDALALCESGPRYFPAPKTRVVGPWLQALRSAGFAVVLVWENEGFVVYRLIHPVADASSAEVAGDSCAAPSHRRVHPSR